MTVYIILPSYNEELGLPLVLKRIQEIQQSSPYTFKAVVVDDGSADKTSDVARPFRTEMDLHLITFPQNRGVAEVFREGFLHVCKESVDPEQDIAIVLDSDNTQDPMVMLQLIERIEGGHDVVIASRFEGEGKMIGCPWTRSVFSYGVSYLLRALVRLPGIKDYSTFYRAYRISVLKRAMEIYGDNLLEGKGFSVAAGLLMKLGNVTREMSEVPLILRYDLKGGTSGNKIMRTISGYLLLLKSYFLTNGFKPISQNGNLR